MHARTASIIALLTLFVVLWPADDADVKVASLTLILGGLFVVLGLMIGISDSRTLLGRVDPFHPLCFPLAYLGFSFLAPAWNILVQGGSLLGFSAADLGTGTAKLITGGVLAFVLGGSLRMRSPQPMGHRVDGRVVVLIGRALLVLTLMESMREVLAHGVVTRGLNQTVYGVSSAVEGFMRMAVPLAIILILIGHRQIHSRALLTLPDLMMIFVVVVSLGLNGRRGAALGVLLALLYVYTRKRSGMLVVVAGVVLGAMFSIVVVQYRNSELAVTNQDSAFVSLLKDTSVVTYTVGATSRAVPGIHPFSKGSTFADAVVRQLPSLIVNRLVGPPSQTGTAQFRQIVGYTNPDGGLGFSLPAEGYLNFGSLGLYSMCLGVGWFLSFTYSRRHGGQNSASTHLYLLALVELPTILRSDSTGAIKIVLYPLLFLSISLLCARAVERRKQRGHGVPGRATGVFSMTVEGTGHSTVAPEPRIEAKPHVELQSSSAVYETDSEAVGGAWAPRVGRGD